MTKTNWILFAAFVAMVVIQGITAGQRDRAKSDGRVLAGLYNGVLIGRGCEPNWAPEDALPDEMPSLNGPLSIRP